MNIELILTLTSGVFALIMGLLLKYLTTYFFPKAQRYYNKYPESKGAKLITLIFRKNELEKLSKKTYNEVLSEHLTNLKQATQEIDRVISEITIISKEKQQTINSLKIELEELSKKENELKTNINTMQNIPIEAVNQFEKILLKQNRRSANRDYILFILGVITTTIVSIVLTRLNWI